jgi:hypothetical protein
MRQNHLAIPLAAARRLRATMFEAILLFLEIVALLAAWAAFFIFVITRWPRNVS